MSNTVKDKSEKKMTINGFLQEHGNDYEPELVSVLKQKYSKEYLAISEWAQKIGEFLSKRVVL